MGLCNYRNILVFILINLRNVDVDYAISRSMIVSNLFFLASILVPIILVRCENISYQKSFLLCKLIELCKLRPHQ